MRRELNLLKCDSWDNLPDVWKVVKKVKPTGYQNKIDDKDLYKILSSYISTDSLRPNMMGAYVEDGSITVTDAFKLINLPFKSTLESGVYRINPKTTLDNTKMYELAKGLKFPAYRNIIQKGSITHKISVYKLKTYIEAVIKGKYCNSVSLAINFKYDKDTQIAFNGKLLIEVLDSFLLLGHTELYVCIDRNAMYFSPNQDTAKNPTDNIGKHPFALLMKLFYEEKGLGAYEIDFGTELTAYYCFECDKIFNADGSVADFDINLENTELPYMNSEYLRLISKVLPKSAVVPITEYIKVVGTIATATNLKYFLKVKDVYVEDGIYEVCNGALKDTKEKIDSFPNFIKDNTFQIAELPTYEISQRVAQVLPFVGDDDLRPVYNGICFDFKDDLEDAKIVSTNAHIMALAKFYNADIYKKNQKFLVEEPKYLSYFLNTVNDESVKIFGYGEKLDKVGFISDDIEYYTRLIDARPPDYEAVIDRNINAVMEFDSEALYRALNSIKGEDAKKNIYFDFETKEKSKGYFSLKLSEKKYGDSELKIVKDLNIKINCEVKPMRDNEIFKSIGLIMPINTEDDNFSFNIQYLKKFLSVTENKMYFDDRKQSPQFIAKLNYIEKKEYPEKKVAKKEYTQKVERVEPKVEEVKPEPKKTDVQATIDALKYLADAGDQSAKDTIESLMFLI